MRITVPTTQVEGLYRPDVPEGIIARNRKYSADYQTVTITLPDTPEAEKWAVEQGYHTPARVTPGRFLRALKAKDADVYAWVTAALDADEDLSLAAREPSFSRGAKTIAELQQALIAEGFAQVTDEWIDELFREAFLWEM